MKYASLHRLDQSGKDQISNCVLKMLYTALLLLVVSSCSKNGRSYCQLNPTTSGKAILYAYIDPFTADGGLVIFIFQNRHHCHSKYEHLYTTQMAVNVK